MVAVVNTKTPFDRMLLLVEQLNERSSYPLEGGALFAMMLAENGWSIEDFQYEVKKADTKLAN